jgi:tetratricopeptide (TPR) repeat protein
VRREVDIERSRNPSPQTYTVTIRLTQRAKLQAKPGVIHTETSVIPQRARELYDKALERSAAKDHKGAIEHLRRAVAEYEPFVDAYNEMGVQYMRLNRLEQAVEALKVALKIKADAFEPLLNHGIALFRLERYVEAEAHLRRTIGIKPDSAIAHYYFGRCLTSLGHFDEAEKALNEAVRLGGSDMNEAHRMLANLFLARGDDKRAIDALELYLALVPKAPDAERLRNIIRQLRAPR